jgi:hypothetical protein
VITDIDSLKPVMSLNELARSNSSIIQLGKGIPVKNFIRLLPRLIQDIGFRAARWSNSDYQNAQLDEIEPDMVMASLGPPLVRSTKLEADFLGM